MIEKLQRMKEQLNNYKIQEAVEKDKKKKLEEELKEYNFQNINELTLEIENIKKCIQEEELVLEKDLKILESKIEDIG
jgi:hypothetical protein